MLATNKVCWLAGIIDGEGCFSIYRKTLKTRQHVSYVVPSAAITITNTSKAMISECQKLLDDMGIKYQIVNPRNSATRPIRRIQIRNFSGQLILLNWVEPYLVAKREQGKLMREFLEKASKIKGFKDGERFLYFDALSRQKKYSDRFDP